MFRWAVTQYTNTYLSECDALSYSLTKRQVVWVVRRWRWLWFIAQYVNVIDDDVLQSNQNQTIVSESLVALFIRSNINKQATLIASTFYYFCMYLLLQQQKIINYRKSTTEPHNYESVLFYALLWYFSYKLLLSHRSKTGCRLYDTQPFLW